MVVKWLIDISALRPHVPAFADVLIPRVAAGLVSICLVTELEIGFSARSVAEFDRVRREVLDLLHHMVLPVRAETRAREVRHELVARDQHRAVASGAASQVRGPRSGTAPGAAADDQRDRGGAEEHGLNPTPRTRLGQPRSKMRSRWSARTASVAARICLSSAGSSLLSAGAGESVVVSIIGLFV